MTINNNTFIDILGLPEWDDKIIEILKQLELERPVLKKDEVDKFLNSDKYGIELFFSGRVTTDLQKELASTDSIFLRHVSFDKNTTLTMPYNIKMGDDHKTIVSKVGRESDTPEAYQEGDCGWGDTVKPYWLQCNFTNDDMENLEELFIRIQIPYKFD